MSGIGAALVRSKLLGALGLACLGFTGLMIALRWAGRELPPAPSRASLQQVRGRVVVVSPADSGIYHHPSSRMQNALDGWHLVVDPGEGAQPVALQVAAAPPFGSSRSLDLARVQELLPRGAPVKAFIHGGPLVWHLERDGRVLVDFEERLAAYERRASLDVWLMVLLPLLGLALCAIALFAGRCPRPPASALKSGAYLRGRT